MYIFSYGSNNTKQLCERVGASNLIPLSGYILDYIRIFAGNSKYRNGGVASIFPSKGQKVFGSLVTLTNDQLVILDGFEVGYDRVVMKVHSKIGIVDSYVYVRRDYKYDKPPSQEYLEAIRINLNEPERKHKEKILIRGVIVNENGEEEIKTFGSWPQ